MWCEEAKGQTSNPNQPAGCEIPCLSLSTWFLSWLWLKFHDCVLVVAKGTLIDWIEIYSAVADCEDGWGVGKEGGVIRKDFTTDGWVTIWHIPCSRWPLVNSFHFFAHWLVFFHYLFLKTNLSFYKSPLTSDSSNPPLTSTPTVTTLFFCFHASPCILKSGKDSRLATAQQRCRWGGTWKPFQGPAHSKVDCFLSSEPLKNCLAVLTRE